jgi:hypothetical protein
MGITGSASSSSEGSICGEGEREGGGTSVGALRIFIGSVFGVLDRPM